MRFKGNRIMPCITILLSFGMIVASWAMAQVPPEPSAEKDKTPKPRIFIDPRVVDLGSIIEGEKATVQWTVINRGKADLIIERTAAACGCTVVKLEEHEKVIQPGGSIILKAEFDSTRRTGEQRKNITLHTNDPHEPAITLDFKVQVDIVFEMNPQGILSMPAVRRGQTAARTLDIGPGPKKLQVEVLSMELPADGLLTYETETIPAAVGNAYRYKFKVSDRAPLGRLSSSAKLRIRAGDREFERSVQIVGEVVADLSCSPSVLNATAQRSNRGRNLSPVTIRSAEKSPFEIYSAEAGPALEVDVESAGNVKPSHEYFLSVRVKSDAQPGPLASTIKVHTSTLNQPILSIPVFAIVAPPVDVEPPLIVLRQDKSLEGTRRLVKLETEPRWSLDISNIKSSTDAIEARLDDNTVGPRLQNLGILEVRLRKDLSKGTHQAEVVVTTGIAGAESIVIPVRIDVPG